MKQKFGKFCRILKIHLILSVSVFRAPLKSDVINVENMRLYSEMVNHFEDPKLIAFYKNIKKVYFVNSKNQ